LLQELESLPWTVEQSEVLMRVCRRRRLMLPIKALVFAG